MTVAEEETVKTQLAVLTQRVTDLIKVVDDLKTMTQQPAKCPAECSNVHAVHNTEIVALQAQYGILHQEIKELKAEREVATVALWAAINATQTHADTKVDDLKRTGMTAVLSFTAALVVCIIGAFLAFAMRG